jgi:hypothetical protein
LSVIKFETISNAETPNYLNGPFLKFGHQDFVRVSDFACGQADGNDKKLQDLS